MYSLKLNKKGRHFDLKCQYVRCKYTEITNTLLFIVFHLQNTIIENLFLLPLQGYENVKRAFSFLVKKKKTFSQSPFSSFSQTSIPEVFFKTLDIV